MRRVGLVVSQPLKSSWSPYVFATFHALYCAAIVTLRCEGALTAGPRQHLRTEAGRWSAG